MGSLGLVFTGAAANTLMQIADISPNENAAMTLGGGGPRGPNGAG